METPATAGDATVGPGGPVRFRIEREHPVAGTDARSQTEALQALGVPTSEPPVRVHLLQHRGLLAPDLVAPLQDAARTAALAAASDLGLDDVDLVLCDYPGLAIEELGVGGYSPGAHLAFLALEPSRPGFARWPEHLPSTVRHELHHARRHAGVGYGPTLLDSLVSEGSATLYEVEKGTRPAYSEVPIDLEAMWQQALPLLERTDQHQRWFFGMEDLPRWTGYTLGTELARRHGVRTGLTAAQLADVPAAAFPASW